MRPYTRTASAAGCRPEASGYDAILNPVGTPSLSQCTVAAVTPGPEIADKPTAGRDGTAEKLSRTTVYVDVKC